MARRIEDRIGLRFLSKLLANVPGRVYFLAQLVDAETNGECGVFDELAAYAEDEELQKMIRRHSADELKHAGLFRERSLQYATTLPEVPTGVKLIDLLDRAVGGPLTRGIHNRVDVMRAYLLLQVLEERTISQLPLFEEAWRVVDPQTADVIAEVGRDEARHLRYCHAISRRYAPDEATLRETLRRYRTIEATEVFPGTGVALIDHCLDTGLLDVGPIERLAWRGLNELARRLPRPSFTHFASEPAAA